MTIPSCLRLYQSKITDAGRGVWTNHGIPKNSLFGPYEGEKIRDAKEAERSGYSWMVSSLTGEMKYRYELIQQTIYPKVGECGHGHSY